ncbi:MAG: hypothetical protein U9N81_00675 [Bacillota bacterium]|nr:hypothetical protein [Bacillota bacterium]
MGTINKRRWIIGIILLLMIALLASAQTIADYYEKSKLEASVELQASLEQMASTESFKYSLKSEFMIGDRREVISEVAGEKESGNTHIKGEMVNTPIDIYYIDGTIYNYDSFADKWLVIESGTANSEDLLISELNPLANFRFKSVNEVEKIGFEEVEGQECLQVRCKPSVESQLLENLWKEFEYLFWIDYKKNYVKKAELTAVNKNNEKTRLEIQVQFTNVGKKLNIEAPETSTAKK